MILELLVLLVAARLAAEVAERLSLPSVATEIAVGILLGPSLLGVVGRDEPLVFLGELGVIILLFQVGLELDLDELLSVGRPALLVAVVGVTLPFLGGTVIADANGVELAVAVFVGASLTATSVGITARVFGDLRRLGTVEARTVLGAAVADDVLGLLILTVVAKTATSEAVSPLAVLWIGVLAIGFVLVAVALGVRLLPPALRLAERWSRAGGLAVAMALIVCLALAEVAGQAGLAPIVGAFLAGLGLTRSPVAERMRRELTPIGQFLIPLFFVQVGVAVDVGSALKGNVLGIAAGLLVVAVAGKVAAGYVAGRGAGDRLTIGLGMLPRGEVGLIFASLGLSTGVLDDRLYGALLLVILVTTLVAPPLLKLRIRAVRAARRAEPLPSPVASPDGRWLEVVDGRIRLFGHPGPGQILEVALQAARLATDHTPSPELLDWFSSLPPTIPIQWDGRGREALLDLLRHGNARSWRLLDTTGLLDRLLPELSSTIAERITDATELDPVHIFRWKTVEAVQTVDPDEYARLEHPDWLLLAALICDLAGDEPSPVAAARQVAGRLGLGAAGEQELLLLVAGRSLLAGLAGRLDGLEEHRVMPVAAHLATQERARALYVLTLADNELDPPTRSRLDDLYDLLLSVLAHPEITGREARNVLERRRGEAKRLTTDTGALARLDVAPRAWLLADAPQELARRAALLDPPLRPGRYRVDITDARIDVATGDRRGVLAAVANVLTRCGVRIDRAGSATWPDGAVIMTFDVDDSDACPAPDDVAERLRKASFVSGGQPVGDIELSFDDNASPWHTVVDVVAPDRPGLLAALAAAFTSAGVSIQSLEATTTDAVAHDRFELTDRHGSKLGPADRQAVEAALVAGSNGSGRRRRGWFTREPAIDRKHSAHSLETTGS